MMIVRTVLVEILCDSSKKKTFQVLVALFESQSISLKHLNLISKDKNQMTREGVTLFRWLKLNINVDRMENNRVMMSSMKGVVVEGIENYIWVLATHVTS